MFSNHPSYRYRKILSIYIPYEKSKKFSQFALGISGNNLKSVLQKRDGRHIFGLNSFFRIHAFWNIFKNKNKVRKFQTLDNLSTTDHTEDIPNQFEIRRTKKRNKFTLEIIKAKLF